MSPRNTAGLILALAALCGAVELENWRSGLYPLINGLDGLHSSPSGMFWDDVSCRDSLFGRLWPETEWQSRDHWHLEPALSGRAASVPFVDGNRSAFHFDLTNDIRYKRLFMRQVLDVDSRYLNDPGYPWLTERFAAGRIEEAYLQLSFEHAFFRLGRLKRNWGPFPDRSLLLSSNPHTFDAFEWQIHADFFEFRHLFAALDYDNSSLDNAGGSSINRYLTAHSLNFIIGRWVTAGVTETVLFGRHEAFPDFQYINPFSIYTVTNTNGEGIGNLFLGFQWDIRPLIESVSLKGQVVIDDIQVDNKDSGDLEPNHWAGDFAITWRDFLPGRLRSLLSLEYLYQSKWMYLVSYNNTSNGQRYTYLAQSLGYPDNDMDRWRLRLDIAGPDYWSAAAAVSYGRNGDNTVTTPWNTSRGWNGYRTETSLRADTVRHTIEAALHGTGYFRDYATLTVSCSNRWIKNRGFVQTGGFEYEPVVSALLTVHYPRLFLVFHGRRKPARQDGP